MNTEILVRNNVQVKGQGDTTMVFAHGFGCDQLVWREVAAAFEEDYQVVLFDYVGSGKSDKSQYSTERYGSLHGYKQDLLEVCAALDLKDIIFVGHSVSSMIGALASIEQPHLMDKLIMVGPSPHYLNEPGYRGGFDKEDIDELLEMMEVNYKEWAKYLAPVSMQNPERPHLAEELEQLLCSNDPVIARQFAEVTFSSDVRDELEKVSVPTLIMQPKYDAIAPPEVGEYVKDKIPASELVVMDAMGHNPHISDAQETVCLIREYIAKH
ncbi:alpha/beta fold hydrolase [Planomicrobium sp. CPCC 101110]|uniref:alpha/beta fold hydrolase n=1 Tax=Planomicrobium sp. CPCC 101110 TaxID=2599619 RepID=UPI0011B75447|nr:alpha/beta hydrolase [Planomicrobium sp. CPCC 101110]TWT27344.1 alpha/beta hydrolase [Planomicrobium sp. CPCC 101110]